MFGVKAAQELLSQTRMTKAMINSLVFYADKHPCDCKDKNCYSESIKEGHLTAKVPVPWSIP